MQRGRMPWLIPLCINSGTPHARACNPEAESFLSQLRQPVRALSRLEALSKKLPGKAELRQRRLRFFGEAERESAVSLFHASFVIGVVCFAFLYGGYLLRRH